MKSKISKAKNASAKNIPKIPSGGEDRTLANAVRKAVSGYIDRRGFWHRIPRRIGVYRKRWLPICGAAGSGKTSLAAKSGLSYELVHSGGRLADGIEAPKWFFSEKAAYIDTSAAMADPQRWHEFCRALKKNKFWRRRAADGMIVVVDIQELLAADRSANGQLAANLRDQADTLVSVSGYEIPLYFVFTKADGIDGFRELFAGKDAAEKAPIIGAVTCDRDLKRSAAEVFSLYYKGIYGDISDLCLLKTIRAEKAEKSRALCRLSAELQIAGDVIAAFFAEFFKYRGRVAPCFRGFFFTSSAMGNGANPLSPLPPQSIFSNRILGDIIPGARFKIRASGVDTAGYWVKKALFNLMMAAFSAVLIFLFAGSRIGDTLYMRKLELRLSAILDNAPTLENQYAALEELRTAHNHFHKRFNLSGWMIFGADDVSAKIKEAYIAASSRIMIATAAEYLESSITGLSARRSGELMTDEHLLLYKTLKTYILLTGGNSVDTEDFADIAEIFELALKSSFGQSSIDNGILRNNVNAVIKLAAVGHYGDLGDKRIVMTARERLTAAPSAQTAYGAIMNRLYARRGFAPVARVTGKNEILRYGHNVSALYTREGWESVVLPELTIASKDPFKADWVMGPIRPQADEARFLLELTSLYANDLSRRWLDFIRNTHVTLPPDLPSLARDLERLSSPRESEIKSMLTAVCSLAARGSGEANAGADAGSVPANDPFAESRRVFGALDNFINGGALDAYLGGLSGIAEKTKTCDAGGGFTQAFAVRGEDPLKALRDELNRAYQDMPSDVSASVKRVLESPIDVAAGALARRIAVEIEGSWNSEVVSYYNDRLTGRYPFNRTGNDVSWSDFEEFFKPQSGVLWKFYDINLSGLTEKTQRGYERRPRRSLSIQLSVSDEILNAYNRAQRVSNSFFANDGAPRRMEAVFHPFRSSNGDAQLWIGEKHQIFQNGLPVTIVRTPGDAIDETIILRLITADRAQEELRFRGEWGMMRFLSAGRIEKHGGDRYRVNWRVNVRNIYTANITGAFQTGTAALFDESIVHGFAVSGKVLGE